MDGFQIPNNKNQFYYNNKNGIIIANSFKKDGYERKIIYKNPAKYKSKFTYGLNFPEIIINPIYINDELNQNNIINYRECITNRELYRKKNIENEKNNESDEDNNEKEESEYNEPNSTMRYEYREEIMSYKQNNINNNDRENKYYYNRTEYNNNNNNNNKLNNSFYYKTQKPPIKYIIYKKRNHKKNKTFVSSLNSNELNNPKFKNENKVDYNPKFPKEDIPLPIRTERESHNSSNDENIKTFKKDIENLNKYDTYQIIKSNNIFNKN